VYLVKLINYYNWIGIYDLYTNTLWVDYLITWDDATFIMNNDWLNIFIIYLINWKKIYFSLYTFSFFSIIDYFLILEITTIDGLLFYQLFMLDIYFYSTYLWLKWNYLWLSNGDDLFFLFFYLNNELIFIYQLFYSYIQLFNINTNIVGIYDIFFFNLFSSLLNYLYYIKWLFILIIVWIISLNNLRYNKWLVHNSLFFSKIYFFLLSLSFENRFQFDITYLWLVWVFCIWLVVLLTYDDIYVEIIELFHSFCIYYFIFIILYLLYKYSFHYFSFLESTSNDSYSVYYLLKQFVRDIANTFALFLRFFLLLFRLNIYDGLDDFLDSYYIFFIDFDDEDYNTELLYLSNSWMFSIDNNEDYIFYLNADVDWSEDLFIKYYFIWGKFFMFWSFILEEIFRVSLAFYIFYLIIFEVHAVNNTYYEDLFINYKRY
jgi:hypothetical protein